MRLWSWSRNARLCLTPNQVEGTCMQATDAGSAVVDATTSDALVDSESGSIDGAVLDATVVDGAMNDTTTTQDDAATDGGTTDEAGDGISADDSGGASSDDAPGE